MRRAAQSLIRRREFLRASLSAAVAAGCLDPLVSVATASPVGADEADTHNMLIVGRQAVFLSHLPMFSSAGFVSPHRYQVLLEATFAKPGSDPQAAYLNDRQANPSVKIYTLNPAEFVLPQLDAKQNPKPLRSFKARILRGHLEKEGNVPLIEDAQVNVKRVIHFRKFDPKAKRPAQLQYILFGKGEELFLAHAIAKPPDFDQVLAVQIAQPRFSDEALAAGLIITINRPNTIAQRLKESQQVKGKLPLTRDAFAGQEIEIKVASEIYLEEGELRVPADFKTTAEEKTAGFP